MKRTIAAVAAILSLGFIPLAMAAPTQIGGQQINRVWYTGNSYQTRTGLNIVGSGSATLPALKIYHPNGGLSFEQKVNGKLTLTGGVLINLGGGTGSGTVIDPGLALEISGTASGRVLHAQNALTSSGSLRINGVMTGATAIWGAGLGDCDTAGTSKLLWDSTTGRFSCGTDTDTNTTYSAGQGLGLSSTVFTLNSTITGSLLKFATVSGSIVHAKSELRSSGSLAIDGAATFSHSSFRLLDGGFANCTALETVSGVLTCGSDAGTTYTAGQGLTLNGSAFQLSSSFSGSSLEIHGIGSGRVLKAMDSLASSGTLVVKGTADISGTLSGNLIRGITSPKFWSLYASGSLAVGSGSFVFGVHATQSGWILTDIQFDVVTSGTTNTSKVQCRQPGKNNRNMLSTPVSIDSTEFTSLNAATPYVINTTNDDVHAGQNVVCDVTAVSTTAPKHATLILTVAKP